MFQNQRVHLVELFRRRMASRLNLKHFREAFFWKSGLPDKTACRYSVDEKTIGFLNKFLDLLLTWPVFLKRFVVLDFN